MKKSQFLTLVSAVSLSVVLGMVVTATLGEGSEPLRAEEGARPTEPLRLVASEAAPAPVSLPSFSALVERANPAVVSVTNIQYQSTDPHRGLQEGPWFRWFFRDPQEGEPDSPRNRVPVQGGGSGFIISDNGYVLTNHHVVEDADKIMVDLEDGRRFQAFLMGSDRHIDLALLKIEAEALPSLPLGDSDGLRVGEWVVAIGNPLNFEHTVTAGVVSGKGRQVPLAGLDGALSEFIQTDAAINFGNSGGPLLNTRGEVVGINAAITRNNYVGDPRLSTAIVQGIGFALPINHAKAVLDQLREKGFVARGYLGVTLNPQEIDADNARVFGLEKEGGALIAEVQPRTPASRAGLHAGDVIVAFDGEPVNDNADLIRRVASLRPDDEVVLDVVRYGDHLTFEVALGDRGEAIYAMQTETEPEPPREEETNLGFRVDSIDRDFLEQADLDLEGVQVTAVDPEGVAYEKGLREGMIIVEMNRQEIRGLSDFQDEVRDLDRGEMVALLVARWMGRRGSVQYEFILFPAP